MMSKHQSIKRSLGRGGMGLSLAGTGITTGAAFSCGTMLLFCPALTGSSSANQSGYPRLEQTRYAGSLVPGGPFGLTALRGYASDDGKWVLR